MSISIPCRVAEVGRPDRAEDIARFAQQHLGLLMQPWQVDVLRGALRAGIRLIRIGCSHPMPLDITSLTDLTAVPSRSLSMCNGCGAYWSTSREPRHVIH